MRFSLAAAAALYGGDPMYYRACVNDCSLLPFHRIMNAIENDKRRMMA